MNDAPFDPSQQPQPAPERRSYTADDLGYPDQSNNFLKNPWVASIVLLLSAGVLVFVIMNIGGNDGKDVPVIDESISEYKKAPDMQMQGDSKDNSQLFAQMGEDMATEPEDLLDLGQSVADEFDMPRRVVEITEPLASEASEDAKIILKDMQQSADKVVEKAQEAVAAIQEDAPTKPDLHAAGSSPETLAFVQSVLNKTEQAYKSIEKETAVETKKVVAGDYYVQLSSIRMKSDAEKEWMGLQARYGDALAETSYRIQEKDLEERGIFYRIQAGPFTKEEASRRCDAVKAIKPAGCFVVAK